MTNEQQQDAKNPEKNEILSTRLVSYPRTLLIRAWSDPELLAQWWGPHGFTNTFHEFDFRPGGFWRFTMHGPGNTNFENTNLFREISLPERIVFDHLEPVHNFTVTAAFEDRGHQCFISFRMVFADDAEFERVREYIPSANEENFDRLEKVLEQLNT